jgi:hypothetical protein
LLAVPAISAELFRYRGAAKDGGLLEYLFESGEQHSPDAITKEKTAEIAADRRRLIASLEQVLGKTDTECERRARPSPTHRG